MNIFPVRKPVTVLMLLLALCLLGTWAAVNIPLGFFPYFRIPEYRVLTFHPGLPSAYIRDLITIPLEDGMGSLKGLTSVSSQSAQGISEITVQFGWGTDMTVAGAELREAVDRIYAALPENTGRPMVVSRSADPEPVMVIAVIPEEGTLLQATEFTETALITKLRHIPGISGVLRAGGEEQEISVEVDPRLSSARNTDILEVARAVSEGTGEYSLGSIVYQDIEYQVSAAPEDTSLEALRNLPIPGKEVKIRDIGKVVLGIKEQRSISSFRGKECTGVLVWKTDQSSPVRISREVRRVVRELGLGCSPFFTIEIVRDSAETVIAALRTLFFSSILGVTAAFLVITVYVKDLFKSLLVTCSIPVSLLVALILLHGCGRSVNLMTLGGLAVGIGMVVDNSVIVIESMDTRSISGISRSVRETSPALFSATLTSVVVFLPVLFLPGMIGAVFSGLALSVIGSLAGSLVYARVIVPALSVLVRRRVPPAGKERPGTLSRVYRRILNGVFRRPSRLLAAAAACAFAGAAASLSTPFIFFEEITPGFTSFTVHTAPGVSVSRLKDRMFSLSRAVGSTWAEGSTGSTGYTGTGSRGALSFIVDAPESAPGEAVLEEGEYLEYGKPFNFAEAVLGLSRETEFILPREDRKRVEAFLKTHEGCRIVQGEPDYAGYAWYLERKREGPSIPPEQVRASISGIYTGHTEAEGKELKIRVRYRKTGEGDGTRYLDGLPLRTGAGRFVPLGTVFSIRETPLEGVLTREGRKNITSMRAEILLQGRKRRAFFQEVRKEFPGVSVRTDSVLAQHKREILTVFLASFLLLYLILGAQFESFMLPLLFLTAVPFSFAGVFLGLLFAGQPFTLNVGIGVLMLFGISVNNSIILYAQYKKILHGAYSEAGVLQGSVERLRPVAITLLTTVFALLPLAVSPLGSAAQRGMSSAVIGGLLVSTVFTMLVFPVFFLTYFRRIRRRSRCSTMRG